MISPSRTTGLAVLVSITAIAGCGDSDRLDPNAPERVDRGSQAVSVNWANVPGGAADVGARGAAWVIGNPLDAAGNASVFRLNASGGWDYMAGAAKRIAAGPGANEAWVATGTGTIFQYYNGVWSYIPNGAASDIGVGTDSSVWVIGYPLGSGSGIFRRNASGGWDYMNGVGKRIDVRSANSAFVVGTDDNIYEYTGSWQYRGGGPAADVGVGADGNVWVARTNGTIYKWLGGTSWDLDTSGMTANNISGGGSDGKPWISRSGGSIYKGTPSSGVTPGSTITRYVSQYAAGNTYRRRYLTYVPTSYNNTARPVVVMLHGGGGICDNMLSSQYGWTSLADTNNFIVVAPCGFPQVGPAGLDEGTGNWSSDRTWNASLPANRWGAVGATWSEDNGVDDVAFVSAAVLDDLPSFISRDSKRVYVAGFSKGAMLAERLACKAGDKFASVFANSGVRLSSDCSGRKPPIRVVHGTADINVSYYGCANPSTCGVARNPAGTAYASFDQNNANWISYMFPGGYSVGWWYNETFQSSGDSTCAYAYGSGTAGVLEYQACFNGYAHAWFAQSPLRAWQFFQQFPPLP